MKSIFINKYSEIRSGWKIALTYLINLFFNFSIGIIIGIVFLLLSKLNNNVDITKYANQIQNIGLNFDLNNIISIICFTINILGCIFTILAVYITWRAFEKKPFKEIGMNSLKENYNCLIKGLILGAISLIIVFVVLLFTKNISLENSILEPNVNMTSLTGMILFIFVGINEELFCRGYCMNVLGKYNNKYVTILVPSLIFALMHSFNSGITVYSYVNLVLFGILSSLMYIKTHNLYMSIGFHIAWNYFEGIVFGFLVSGQTTCSIYELKSYNNNLLTGGTFGPEGGIVVTIVLILGIIYFYKHINNSTNIEQKTLKSYYKL